jgi:hypothetical protein
VRTQLIYMDEREWGPCDEKSAAHMLPDGSGSAEGVSDEVPVAL